MNRSALDADFQRKAWHADALVGWRLADARAHAERGDLATAKARVDELEHTLVAKLRDARGDFYRRSFALHRQAGLDPDVHQFELQPTPDGEEVARNAEILGRSLTLDVGDLVADAVTSLTSATLAANDQRTHAAARSGVFAGWETSTRQCLVGVARRELSDSQIAIYEAIGHILVRPELR